MKNLINLRKNKGVSQLELADFLKVKQSVISHFETGRNEPDVDTLIKLSDYFNCSIDYLLGHQAQNVLYLDSYTPVQKKLVELIQKLNDEQGLFLIGYLSDMLKIPYEEVKPQRPW